MNEKIEKKIKELKKSRKKISINFTKTFSRILIVGILFLGGLIYVKVNEENKTLLYKEIYEKNLSFGKANEKVNDYLGDIIPLENFFRETKPVFKENLEYTEVNMYKDGAILKVNTNYLVPIAESGIVVFIGEKEGYGNTVIVQQINGIDMWYGNVTNINANMYEYIEKGSPLGETIDDKLYVVWEEKGEYKDYKEYLW